MVAMRFTPFHSATTVAAARPSVVVLAEARNTYGCKASGAVSRSVLGPSAMKTRRFSLAISDTAGPSPDVKVPRRKPTRSRVISSRDTRTASSGRDLVSRGMISTLRPSRPPDALSSSAYILAPATIGSPNCAPAPERIMGMPTLIGSCADAAVEARSDTASASLRKVGRVMPPAPHRTRTAGRFPGGSWRTRTTGRPLAARTPRARYATGWQPHTACIGRWPR